MSLGGGNVNGRRRGGGNAKVAFSGGSVCCFLVVALLFIILAAVGAFLEDIPPLGQAIITEETRVGNAYIGLFIVDDLNADEREAFDSAAAKWSAIVGGTLGQFTGRTIQPGEELCDGDLLSNGTFVADHLLIAARIAPIDGRGKVLGFAAPCELDPDVGFPILGEMVFDKVDVAELIQDGVLNDVILHEMGHVLGIGTLWDAAIQGQIIGEPAVNGRLLQDPVLGVDEDGFLFVRQTNIQPKFVGSNAITEIRTAASNNNLNFVPVEDGTFNGQEIFGNRINGAGSIDGHWDLEPLGNELMTFQIDPDVADHPLSRITVASLQDLGYIVDLNLADDFTIPSFKGKRLRGKKYVMAGDIARRLLP